MIAWGKYCWGRGVISKMHFLRIWFQGLMTRHDAAPLFPLSSALHQSERLCKQVLTFAACCLCLTACATLFPERRADALREKTLLKAGFNPVSLSRLQEKELVSLGQLRRGKITALKRHGKVYFVFPDIPHHRILVGCHTQFIYYDELMAQELASGLTPPWKKCDFLELESVESGVWEDVGL